ncbi:MAG: hypothetical protein HZA34_02125 [Candidatus Pacebacteria bacterium]|nr:hypothetical protein [Candidatus Paceibacterota bacterium]
MPRSQEYQRFLDVIQGRKKDDLLPHAETTATAQEIGWWKQFQIRRAIHHARYGVATNAEIHLLHEHGISVSRMAKVRTQSHEE